MFEIIQFLFCHSIYHLQNRKLWSGDVGGGFYYQIVWCGDNDPYLYSGGIDSHLGSGFCSSGSGFRGFTVTTQLNAVIDYYFQACQFRLI